MRKVVITWKREQLATTIPAADDFRPERVNDWQGGYRIALDGGGTVDIDLADVESITINPVEAAS